MFLCLASFLSGPQFVPFQARGVHGNPISLHFVFLCPLKVELCGIIWWNMITFIVLQIQMIPDAFLTIWAHFMLTVNPVLYFSDFKSNSDTITWYGFTYQFASHPCSPLLEVCRKLKSVLHSDTWWFQIWIILVIASNLFSFQFREVMWKVVLGFGTSSKCSLLRDVSGVIFHMWIKMMHLSVSDSSL